MPRFPPGQSGNPKGRPKGARGVTQQFLAEVARRAEGQGDDEMPVSKLQALIRAQVDKAVKGDTRAMEKVLERVEALDAKLEAANAAPPAYAFTQEDRETIAEIWRRLSCDDSSPRRGATDGLVGCEAGEEPSPS